ncbi:MAG: DUF302 domain-containing protein [Nitriliruptoraceae bacterium]
MGALVHDRYVLRVRTDDTPAEAEVRVRAELAAQGFGVLTEIDVAQTLADKLGVDIPAYRILGACKPQYAHEALTAEPEIGALLPCNVVVRSHPDGGSELLAIDPNMMLGIADVPGLSELAADVERELAAALTAAAA